MFVGQRFTDGAVCPGGQIVVALPFLMAEGGSQVLSSSRLRSLCVHLSTDNPVFSALNEAGFQHFLPGKTTTVGNPGVQASEGKFLKRIYK